MGWYRAIRGKCLEPVSQPAMIDKVLRDLHPGKGNLVDALNGGTYDHLRLYH